MRSGKGWKAVELDEVEALPWAGAQVRWHPLRERLDARIVGIAAFTAEQAGDDVIEPHDEANGGRGHEEIYVVLRGRARFRLDGDELDAAAGTFVLVSDTHVHRHAIAQEPGTAVLALGGPPTFEPSASEWIERARPHLRSDPGRARAILDDLRTTKPDSVGVHIGEALWEAAQGNFDTAREYLKTALSADPSVRAALQRDPDIGPLFEAPPFGRA
jgi:AraC-like ligand binding domain